MLTEAWKTFNETRRELQQSVFDMFKGLSLSQRLTQGVLMSVNAVASAALAYTIAQILNTEQPVWAAITAILVTQHSYSDTMSLARDQVLGALVGAVLGFAGVALGGSHYFLAYVTAVFATIMICWAMNAGSAARLGGVTATMVLLIPGNGSLWDIPLTRLGEVVVGTACAVGVTWVMNRIEQRYFGV